MLSGTRNTNAQHCSHAHRRCCRRGAMGIREARRSSRNTAPGNQLASKPEPSPREHAPEFYEARRQMRSLRCGEQRYARAWRASRGLCTAAAPGFFLFAKTCQEIGWVRLVLSPEAAGESAGRHYRAAPRPSCCRRDSERPPAVQCRAALALAILVAGQTLWAATADRGEADPNERTGRWHTTLRDSRKTALQKAFTAPPRQHRMSRKRRIHGLNVRKGF